MKTKIFLIAIILIAAILRLWKLNSYPALNADEAAIGYNAYSLIQTGMDEHGHSWPIHFQSFNDYKPGLYFYMVLPFVKVLGLNEWAVRLPNAILGILTVFILYLFANELFPKKFVIWDLSFGIWSAGLLAISPWHIHFSRGGWEVNVATFFILLGIYLFLKFINSKNWYFLLFTIFAFTLSLYTYHAARIIVPFLGLGLAMIYRKELFSKNNLKIIFLNSIFFIILMIPLGRDLVRGNVLDRAAGVGLFSDLGPINRINEQRGEHGNFNSLPAKLVHNKFVNYSLAFFNNYTTHFSGEFLFMTGDSIERDKVPETGEMYLFDIFLLAIGFFVIIRNYSLFPKNYQLILLWLLIAPVAAALTFQAPHALRAENMVIPLTIISGLGLATILHSRKRFVLLILGILMIWNFLRYEEMYWNHMSKEYPYSSQYGVKELVSYISDNQDKYNDIIVSTRYDQPYILLLFYLKYPPQRFQGSHNLTSRDDYGFSTVPGFDKYHFEKIDLDAIKEQYPGSLVASAPSEISGNPSIIKRIYGTNGLEYFDLIKY